ncbi:MAG: hypothetical protein NVS3B7_19400 [Candidatus Elarobacter sp.]
MKWGLSGVPVPDTLRYAREITRAATDAQASPCALYAIAWRETLAGERSGWLRSAFGTDAAHVVSPDGGHGIFQLTDSFPPNWQDPYTNAKYAAERFYDPYLALWINRGFSGPTLLKLAADDFNAGDRRVKLWHDLGNADGATTGGNYGTDVLVIFSNLLAGRDPDYHRPT